MKRIFSILLLTVALSSCDHFHGKKIRGDGNVTKEDRSVSGFSGIYVSGGIKVIVRQDSAYKVQVETDYNLHPFIEIYKEGNALHIRQQDNTSLDATGSIKVYVSSPVLEELMASGACSISTDNRISGTTPLDIDLTGASNVTLDIRYPSTKMKLSGASTADIKGETKDLSAKGSGACELHLFDLLTENATVDVSGASSADVYASVKLNVDASGASNVKYKGAAQVVANKSGASDVKKAD
jgi:hypothetical protein